jgi:L-alanine-DL-glutamate epimerase-like enolase superfamily enzyme
MTRIAEIVLRRLRLKLSTPYKVAGRVFDDFDPIVVEMRDSDGRTGFGETVISEGYTNETPEGGWRFCHEMAERIVGLAPDAAKRSLEPHIRENSHAASVLITAIEMIEGNALLELREPAVVPLLVPVMLDESIYGIDEIERAARLKGVGYVKVKLKKLGGLDRLKAALDRMPLVGLKPVLGDGVSTELSCWMEACVARSTIRNAAEMNGFLKVPEQLFAEPLPFADGTIRLPAGWRPRLDATALERTSVAVERFSPTR